MTRTVVCRADYGNIPANPGKTLRVGDSYKVVDSSNSNAFVLIGEVLLTFLLVVKNGLAKPIYPGSGAHEATKHLVTTKQLRFPSNKSIQAR